MKMLREWAFPVALITLWIIAAAYALSLMLGPKKDATIALRPAAVEQLAA